MLAVEIGVVKAGDSLGVEQTAYESALEQMLGYDFLNIVRSYLGIESTLGIHNDDGTERTKTEAAGLYDLDLALKTGLFDFFFKMLEYLIASGGVTAGTAANEDMGTNHIFLPPYLALAPMVYSTTGEPLTICCAKILGTLSGVTWT